MQAYHNDKKIKAKYVSRVREHKKADEIIKGQYWANGKGCAVGCTIHSSNHSAYETELGIPEWLARVEDTIFEGLPNARAKLWPGQLLLAIPIGADLNKIKAPFTVVILKSCLRSMKEAKFNEKENPQVVAAIKQSTDAVKEMIRCFQTGLDTSAARSAAESAARSARSAARSAAESAESAARSARSAARSAESATWSAELAESAAWSAWSAAESAESAARSARSAARSATYEHFADELLKLIRSL